MYEGPAAYDTPEEKIKGGTWSQYKVLSDFDLRVARAAETPAPGTYHDEERFSTLTKNGGKMNTYKTLRDVELNMKRAAQIPGPSDYDTSTKNSRSSNAARISESRHITDLDRRIKIGASTPAPGRDQPNNSHSVRLKLKTLKKRFDMPHNAMRFAAKLSRKAEKARQLRKSQSMP